MSGEIIKKLSSLKFTIILFLLIIPILIVGGIIPQNYQPQFYITNYPHYFHIILLLSLDHIFKSFYFLFLLFLLTINLLSCLYTRLPAKIRAYRERKILSISQMEKLRIKEIIPRGENLSKAESISRKLGYRIKSKDEKAFYAAKGVAGWWGSEIFHIGLLILFVGGMISAIYSKSYFLQLTPGEKRKFAGRYEILLISFKVPRYEDGSPEQYMSKIDLFENSKKMLNYTLWVNHPLHFKKFWIYQSDYGVSPFKIRDSKFLINCCGKEEKVTVQFNKEVTTTIAGEKISFFCPIFIPDFVFDVESEKISSRSLEHNNPALFCNIKGPEGNSDGWFFLKFTGFNSKLTKNLWVKWISYNPLLFSGIQINYDPGKSLFFAGAIIMIIGLFLSIYIPYQRIWITKYNDKIYLGGISYRGEEKLKKDIMKIKGKIEDEVV